MCNVPRIKFISFCQILKLNDSIFDVQANNIHLDKAQHKVETSQGKLPFQQQVREATLL